LSRSLETELSQTDTTSSLLKSQRPDHEFARWWVTPDVHTGVAPSAALDLGSAQKAWAAARALPRVVPKSALTEFAEKLASDDPAVQAELEEQFERVAAELSRTMPPRAEEPIDVAQPVLVPSGRFEEVGAVWHERVNSEYHATLNDDLVTDGEKLYRFVANEGAAKDSLAPAGHGSVVRAAWIGVGSLPHKATMVVVTDFENYALAYQRYDLGETRWFDAHIDTDRDVPLDFVPTHWLEIPGRDQGVLDDALDADDIAKLRDALVWMGESTSDSLEECSIYRVSLVRRLIAANLAARDYAFAEAAKPDATGGPVRDHEIRELVNQLRDVAIKFHHTGQLRSRIQDIVLPMMVRAAQKSQ
jgi:hypothetical protein